MAKYTPAQARAIKKYLKNFKDMRVRVSSEDKFRYEQAADTSDMSLTQFVIAALEEKIARDHLE